MAQEGGAKNLKSKPHADLARAAPPAPFKSADLDGIGSETDMQTGEGGEVA